MSITKFLLTLLWVSSVAVAAAVASPLADAQSTPNANYYNLIDEESANNKPDFETFPPVRRQEAADSALTLSPRGSKPSAADEAAMQISLENPEFRLIGAQRVPVRMNDDLETRVMVAVDNLRKDAGDLWGSVSSSLGHTFSEARSSLDRQFDGISKSANQGWQELNKGLNVAGKQLDKSWTDLRALVEKQLASNKPRDSFELQN